MHIRHHHHHHWTDQSIYNGRFNRDISMVFPSFHRCICVWRISARLFLVKFMGLNRNISLLSFMKRNYVFRSKSKAHKRTKKSDIQTNLAQKARSEKQSSDQECDGFCSFFFLPFLHSASGHQKLNQFLSYNASSPRESRSAKKKKKKGRKKVHKQTKTSQLKRIVYFFFLANFSFPISAPRSLTLRTRSIFERTFWSGVAEPRSKSCTTATVVLHFVASSFCVIL